MTWSSQQFILDGREAGVDPAILQNAAAQIERILIARPDLPAVLSLNHLATRVGVSYFKLRKIVARGEESYTHFRIRKRSGGHRLISIPEPSLMRVQRWIAAHILSKQSVHHCSFAFSPGASILKCASRHTGARWLIKMDVSAFFGSISEIQVYRVFQEIGYEPLVAFELARLTTHSPIGSSRYRLPSWRARNHPSPITSYWNGAIGYLPQGAPTSPMLSNLVMRDADKQIEAIAKSMNVRYTRYSDDLTFSTTGDFSRENGRILIRRVARTLRQIGLKENRSKTTIVPPGGRKVVLGLLVDGPKPRLTRSFRAALRQHLFYLEKYGPRMHSEKRSFDSIWGMYRHIRGLVDFANMIEHSYAKNLLQRLNAVQWPYHPSDP
ncbi:RNA-directed DNA polymerase [Bradyrhizobium sp. UFLA06-06]